MPAPTKVATQGQTSPAARLSAAERHSLLIVVTRSLPRPSDRRHVGRYEDIALLAAFAPTDESAENQQTPEDANEQGKPEEPK